MIQIQIDGQWYEAREGETILDVAKRNGIWIPALCHHPAVKPYGACRLCLVEVLRRGRPVLVTACSYPVSEGLIVNTQSELVKKARKGMMELILARAPKNPALRALSKRMGVDETRFPTIIESQRDCILCGLCVRICAEVIGMAAIGFANRGVNRIVAPPFLTASDDCVGCGACAAVCPVGTIELLRKEGKIEVSPFCSRVEERCCSECGAPLTGEPFARQVEEKLGELRSSATLCDECKRRRSANALVKVASVSPAA